MRAKLLDKVYLTFRFPEMGSRHHPERDQSKSGAVHIEEAKNM